jgi:hypothetical protein
MGGAVDDEGCQQKSCGIIVVRCDGNGNVNGEIRTVVRAIGNEDNIE